jgi:hypothetical protein
MVWEPTVEPMGADTGTDGSRHWKQWEPTVEY